MLIDAHTHIWISEMREPSFLRAVAWRNARTTLPFKKYSEIDVKVPPHYNDPDADKWARDMAYVGIDAAVSQPNDFGSAEGWAGECAPLSVYEIHEVYARWAERHKGKFFSFIGINPMRGDAVELLERGVKELGMKGLKLLPHTGFYPNDRVCYRLYEKCAELEVPVCIHTGAGIFRYPKYANPVHVAEPALDFPEIEFIMAHAGGGLGQLTEEAITTARFIPNINLDLAQWAPTVIKGGGLHGNLGKYKDHIPQFLDILDIMRNTLIGGCANILFATDYPTYPIEVLKGWCDLFLNLPEVAAQHGYEFSREETDLMCCHNAIRIMKLPIKEK